MTRLIKAALALVLLVAGATAATAQTRELTLDEEYMLQRISQHNTEIRTMAGRFVQVDSQGGRTEGVFWLKRPNHIRFRYGPPSREEIISQGRGFYVINREERSQYAYNQEHVPLRQVLGDEVNLMTSNLTDVVMSETHVSVSLVDDTPIGTVQVSLIFERETLDLAQWSLIEPSGVETTFSIYDTQKNIDIPDSYFYIDPTYSQVQR
ncbi:LolA family protein [Pelagibacterium xiamenense]|uniref:LolA family protein n=1 Tax=Pelagibacterium xiamenense TaxID=2901140 RepID=UPI001E3291C9|nr:outer membrane lipoprotein carrier protein LolA [Pelagibacterium xiamenense]MCD7058412.1 outer membrane lipoprotein carrier protein LolA [Pelagibacterium xiamenense]